MEIKVQQFLKEPDTGKLKSVVIISGDDALLKGMVVDKLREKLALKSFWGDEAKFDEVINSLKVQSLFGQSPSILIRDAKEFLSSLSKDQFSVLLQTVQGLKGQRLILLFTEDELPKTDTYKKLLQISDLIICGELSKQAFITSLRKKLDREGLKIEEEDLEYLSKLLNYNLHIAKQEVEKLMIYCKEYGVIKREDIDNLVIAVSESNVFEFIELFLKKDVQALEAAIKLVENHLHPFQIQTVLFTQLERLYYYKVLLSQGLELEDIFNRLKVGSNIQKLTIQRLSKLISIDELENLIEHLYKLEIDQKVYYKDIEKEFLKFIVKSVVGKKR
ncbi:MAG: DNA polymerase III subunit delta [Hydrogenothermaceae bacterium]|nr:DNA polymerase III subunit delta [Hydrogenothermaceae bacterium]